MYELNMRITLWPIKNEVFHCIPTSVLLLTRSDTDHNVHSLPKPFYPAYRVCTFPVPYTHLM